MDELVFAIPTTKLWSLISYKEQGYIPGKNDVLKGIVKNGQFRKREELEEDPSFKQIIPYAIISCKNNFYLFKRTSKQREKRLHNQLTLGVGGHMNPRNVMEPYESYLIDELKRELFEELTLLNDCLIENIDFIGFINDDTISVGRVHIGLLYNIQLTTKDVIIRETDKLTADWVNKDDLTKVYDGLETWSQIAFNHFIA